MSKRAPRYERGRFYLEAIKRETGCIVCGEDEPAALDFHHLDEGQKSFNLSGIAYTKPLAALREEVDKCVVLCASCHRKVHAGIIELTPNGDN
jgi:uncharacterized protein (DUF983 family)